MASFKIDLHLHSCLSPCGDLDMSPDRIVAEGVKHGLAMMALTDHNSCLNTPPFLEHCNRMGITGLAGAEVTTAEEAHILALFPEAEPALDFGRLLWEALPRFPHDPEKLGDQVQVDTENTILSTPERYLINAVTYTISEIVKIVHDRGGLVIPAHIDRPFYSLISQLGFIPDEPFDAVEITKEPYPDGSDKWTPIASSDAHYPGNIAGRYTLAEMEKPTFSELGKALINGRTTPVLQK